MHQEIKNGITCEVNDEGHMPAAHLPGATLLPSHRGDFGGRYGDTAETPVEFVVDGEQPGVATSQPPDSDGSPAPQPPDSGESPASQLPKISHALRARARSDAAGSDDVLAALARIERALSHPEPTLDATQASDDAPGPDTGHAPGLDVVFQHDDLGSLSCRYHAAVETRSLLVLVYDTRWVYGSRYTPPVNQDRVLSISVTETGGGTRAYTAVYMGIAFVFDSMAYTVFVLADPRRDD